MVIDGDSKGKDSNISHPGNGGSGSGGGEQQKGYDHKAILSLDESVVILDYDRTPSSRSDTSHVLWGEINTLISVCIGHGSSAILLGKL